jgi:hypothetical protein
MLKRFIFCVLLALGITPYQATAEDPTKKLAGQILVEAAQQKRIYPCQPKGWFTGYGFTEFAFTNSYILIFEEEKRKIHFIIRRQSQKEVSTLVGDTIFGTLIDPTVSQTPYGTAILEYPDIYQEVNLIVSKFGETTKTEFECIYKEMDDEFIR